MIVGVCSVEMNKSDSDILVVVLVVGDDDAAAAAAGSGLQRDERSFEGGVRQGKLAEIIIFSTTFVDSKTLICLC
jgi:hypothetical protein